MDWRYLSVVLLMAFVITNCSKTKEMVIDRTRSLQPADITSFHPNLNVTVGWIPYTDHLVFETKKNEWMVLPKEEGDPGGMMPTILVIHPQTQDTVFLNLNIENELLGKLIKHSVMTQEPIKRPFSTFFETAKCQKCHPADIELPFK